MSKGLFVLMTCLLACSTITAQLDVIDDEEFAAAVAEAGASVPSPTREEASTSSPPIAAESTSTSAVPEPSFESSARVPSTAEGEESSESSDSIGSIISTEDFDDDDASDNLDGTADEDGASNAKVLTIMGSCIAALGALVLF